MSAHAAVYTLAIDDRVPMAERPHQNRQSAASSGTPLVASAHRWLNDATIDRIACLCRHWTWANEAMTRFERELFDGWEYDEDLVADRPFGAYYEWCALLCGLAEAALEGGLLPIAQLDVLRPDLEASLPRLQACRRLLVVIPSSLEQHPRIVDLLRKQDTLDRLRRLHVAFGEALLEERRARELALLDPD